MASTSTMNGTNNGTASNVNMMSGLLPGETAFLEACRRFPNGITDDQLSAEIPDIPLSERATIVNSLLKKGMITLLTIGGRISYLEVNSEEVLRMQTLSPEERIIYQIIKQADNMGIWSRDIRIKSNLQQTHVTKALKVLESKKIIKSVKSVESKNKKLFMLFEIEPSRKITGGAWYSEQEIDSEFIEILQKQCYRYIFSKTFPKEDLESIVSTHSLATAEEVHASVQRLKISKIDLTVEDIMCILDTLVFDGKIEQHGEHFRAIKVKSVKNAIVETPCGTCPVFAQCSPDGPINPMKCEYLTKWLQM